MNKLNTSELKKYHKELKDRLDEFPKPSKESVAFMARYIGGVNHEKRKPDEQSKLVYLGVGMSNRRGAKLSFSKLPKEDQAQIWDYIWHNSNTFEEKASALEFFNQKSVLKEITKYWDIVKHWVKDIDNWAHSDTLSGIYAKVLETDHKKYLPFFEKLNKSKNPWERRQSVVGLYFYTRLREKTLPAKIGLKFVESLLDDPHVYIQKGVGWTLREIYQVDSKAQLEFVRKNVKRIKPHGYYATVEKYTPQLKKEIKALRQKK